MDSNSEDSYAISISTDYNTFDVDGLWRNDQFESPDDPTAFNELLRIADDPALDHSAFTSDAEQFEQFEQSGGLADEQWYALQATPQVYPQRHHDIPLDTIDSIHHSSALHASRHDSVATTAQGEEEKRATTPTDAHPTSQTLSGAQKVQGDDLLYHIDQHKAIYGRHLGEPDDQHISETDWQHYENGIKEIFGRQYSQEFQPPGATPRLQHTTSHQLDYSGPSPSSKYGHEQITGASMPQAPTHDDYRGSWDTRRDIFVRTGILGSQNGNNNYAYPPIDNGRRPGHYDDVHPGEECHSGQGLNGLQEDGYEDAVNSSQGDYTYRPSSTLQRDGYEQPFQPNSDHHAYLGPPHSEHFTATHPDQYIPMPMDAGLHPDRPTQIVSSDSQYQPQTVTPRRLLSEEEKVHLANVVRSKQVAYGDQVNAMILKHEIDYYPPIPLTPYPKQQDKSSIDHGLSDQYEHLSTEEILAGAVHPDQMFGGLILRLSKTYNNKDLGDRIDALLGKKMDRSTYTIRISNAVRAAALREGITTEQFRARLNQERPPQASKN
ncbi:uncharacterized protein MYCFIDRAFT_84515 [Pseudocercospora fijiensis CIRAD86]|uniref:Uncharacterized protein n=1 Tax=Pseudocercospora fijiensis (strain CIRAD86) TaxID=383855 RepID=M3A5G9_PSEFD|nr:uncharacterized protein MYCFIDRAFT_84515 [Pseudocercospora fijiensis CIRAD86]EME86374.1 hypothetical protein MYCFIDRAFT_84515 [Pseudocercospora fijiensis CIRAD86]